MSLLGPQRLERRAQFFYRSKDAVLRRARPEPERAADFLDRAALVVPKREGRALERAQRSERVRDAALDFRALREALGTWRCDAGHLDHLVEVLASRLVVPGLFRAHQIHRAVRDDPVEPRAEVRT